MHRVRQKLKGCDKRKNALSVKACLVVSNRYKEKEEKLLFPINPCKGYFFFHLWITYARWIRNMMTPKASSTMTLIATVFSNRSEKG